VTRDAIAVRDGIGRRRNPLAAAYQSAINPNPRTKPMSKLMMLFVLCMSGALYDPPRVLHQLGPEAAAVGWKIASTLRLR
jgi:hypothetical protein